MKKILLLDKIIGNYWQLLFFETPAGVESKVVRVVVAPAGVASKVVRV
jgi:hypothetical protein